jgi:hypothetical protein
MCSSGTYGSAPISPRATAAWSRSQRSSLAATSEHLPFHLDLGRQNGLAETEVDEAITHLAFYTGWPKAKSAVTAAKTVFEAGARWADERAVVRTSGTGQPSRAHGGSLDAALALLA